MVYLAHHGIKGQRWGERRFQNEDGSLTEAGKSRYSDRQRKRDERIYGRKAADRIQKRIDEGGEGVQSARHQEVVNRQRKNAVKDTASQILAPVKAAAIAATGAAILAFATNPELRQKTVRKGKDILESLKTTFGKKKLKDVKSNVVDVDAVLKKIKANVAAVSEKKETIDLPKADTTERFKSLMHPNFGYRTKSGAMPFYLRDRKPEFIRS